jgi:hypothetical protein
MIGIGFLVKAYPNLIAGYNTMSKERKESVDIEGLSTMMRNGLIAIGITIILGNFLFKWIGLTQYASNIILAVTFIGTIFLVISAQKYDHSKKKNSSLTYAILGIILLAVIGLLAYGYMPAKPIITNDSIRFTGMYGFEIPTSDIESVELLSSIPTVKLRTNGFSLGSVHKGFFNLEKYGKCRLLLHSNKPPFLDLSRSHAEKIIINYKDQALTEEIHDKLRAVITD